MKHPERTATSSSPGSQKVTDETKKPAQDESRAAEDSGQKIDRPGFDYGGLLATHMPGQAWALAMMHPTRRTTDGFLGGGLTRS